MNITPRPYGPADYQNRCPVCDLHSGSLLSSECDSSPLLSCMFHVSYRFAMSVGPCQVRIRLTPSQPNKRGAVWFQDPLPINLVSSSGIHQPREADVESGSLGHSLPVNLVSRCGIGISRGGHRLLVARLSIDLVSCRGEMARVF
jgi:hypothetical protein